ncbi:MAG: fibronectin type III domain-containing protein [Bacillota bacterium]|jgi:hypothetical protein
MKSGFEYLHINRPAKGSSVFHLVLHLLVVFICVMFFSPVWAVENAKPERIILTWTMDPTTSQTITWLMPDAGTGWVEYLSAEEYTGNFDGAQKAEADCENFDSVNYRYTVNLTGLIPGEEYVYRVGRNGAWSEPLTFTTASDQEKFTFLYMGDVQSGYDVWGQMLDTVYQDYPQIKFALLGGDLIDNDSDEAEWEEFLDAATGVFSKIPVMPTMGNHDGLMYVKFFALPDNGPEGLKQEFYSFDYGPAHFIVLNSGKNTDERVKQWLTHDLENTNKAWKFVMFHVPAYPATHDYKGIDKSIQDNWVPILEQYRVDMVFVGHQHLYMRTHPIFQGEIKTKPADGIVYVMGNAGTKTYAGGSGFPYIAREETGSNYQVIEIDGNALTLTAKKATGELIESYTINKENQTGIRPVYTIVPQTDLAYTVGITPDGINYMSVKPGTAGFKYFTCSITPVNPHHGLKTVVFVHLRDGVQLGLNATKADFDQVNTAQAGFNVKPGDIIKVYIVDELTNDTEVNPVILQ